MKMATLRALQINLHHSSGASAALLKVAGRRKYEDVFRNHGLP